MLEPLHCHAEHPLRAKLHLEAEARREGERLRLRYVLTGELEAIAIPSPAAPERREGLWQHSCFEAFIQPEGGGAYFELNFAPSTEWAAYRFDSHRSGMAEARDVPRPEIDVAAAADRLLLEAVIDLRSSEAAARAWHVGLSAVIEDRAGNRSFWALAHPPGVPDFHHRDCFALRIDAPAGS